MVLPMAVLVLAFTQTFHLRPFGIAMVDISYHYLLLALLLPLCFIWIPASRKVPKDGLPWYDFLLLLISLSIPIFFVYHSADVLGGWNVTAPPSVVALSLVLWLVVLEGARRAAGPVFAGIIGFFSFYPLFAVYMPGILWAPSVGLSFLVAFQIISVESLMGIVMKVFGNIIVGFMVFAVVVQMVGAGKFFNDLALAMVGNTRAGIAKVSVVSSALFGSLSGASMANVFVTGAFTIPAMKREGFPAPLAAAVEAVASTGGILMPPVMGSVAFIMAEFMGVSYAEVAIAALVPIILYYVCLFAHVDSWAARVGLKPPPITVEVPPIWRTLVNNFHIIVSFIVLILLIFFLRLTSQSPWIACAFVIVLGMFRKETRITPKRLVGFIEDLGRILGELMATIAPIGLIIGAFVITGIAFNFPYLLVSAAGGNVYLLLLLGALAAFILGMGVPIAAVYIFLAIVLAPALVTVGLDRMAAHLFVLYCAMQACITPPVAITAFAAASIADASPMKTGFYAMRLAVSKYILPFIFVLSPALVLQGTPIEALKVIPSILVGFVVVSGAFEGYFWRIGNLTAVSRAVLLGAGLLLAWPGLLTDYYGAGILVVFFALYSILRWQKSPLLRVMLK